mmetsp:Transcript_19794/g.47104  ORF Transcript_19794/g.47104 Transcript_19794/m.47104 type:complete len:103 (-) Transcript_19794:127-435(-)
MLVDATDSAIKAEVRCCSESYMAIGDDWKAQCGIWSSAKVPGSDGENCDIVTYAEAVDRCAQYDARLCTRNELSRNCADGMGCYDKHMVWALDEGYEVVTTP